MSDLYLGDCREVRSALADNSVDTIITDPPYGLEFMGKGWDRGVPGVEFWKEFLAVAKPGAMLLAFGGTRTFHRMTCAIEDAGWEIRDCMMWLYGSGFPKSLDISKAIDKAKGVEREVVGHNPKWNSAPKAMNPGGGEREAMPAYTSPATDLARAWNGWGTAMKPAVEPIIVARKPFGDARDTALKSLEGLEKSLCTALSEQTATPQYLSAVNMCLSTVTSWKDCLAEYFRQQNTSTIETIAKPIIDLRTLNSCLSRITPDGITKAAMQHGGLWSHVLPVARYLNAVSANISSTLALFALESAIESGHTLHPDAIAQDSLYRPIIVAMKPLDGTFAQNAEKWGVAGINVDGGRIGIVGDRRSPLGADGKVHRTTGNAYGEHQQSEGFDLSKGRWPANLLLDEEAAAMLDEQSGVLKSHGGGQSSFGGIFGNKKPAAKTFASEGGASRFFYCAKASKSERNKGCEETLTWETPDQNSLTESIAQHARAISEDTVTGLSRWSIESFGKPLSEPSQKALTSITSTVSRLIIALRTCASSQNSTINGFIRAALGSLAESGLSPAASVELLETLKQTSTDEKTASVLGASLAVLQMLSVTSASANRGNCHSTVKPLALMEYLCALTKTPTGGIVLDPFAGSGTTLLAAKNTGREYIGIEQNPEYFEIIKARLGV